MVLSASVASGEAPRRVAIEAPRLSQLLDRARLVVAAAVDEVTTYDDGRLAVARLRVRTVIKGTPPLGEVHVIEMRNLPVPPAFVVGDHVLTFLQPAKRNSYLDHNLPSGRYFEPVRGHGAVLKGSAAPVARSASLVERLIVLLRTALPPERVRTLIFDFVDAPHTLLVEDGAHSLHVIPRLPATLTADEHQRLAAVLERPDLPPRVQRALIEAIARTGLTQLIPALRRLPATTPEVMLTRWQALEDLGQAPSEDEFNAYLASPDPSTRQAAARGFLQLHGAETIPRVAELALRDPDPTVRVAVIDALGDSRLPEALPTLEGAFSDPSWKIAQAATRAISRIGGRPAAESFARLAFRAPAERQRYAAMALLALGVERDDPLAVRIAQSHPNEEVRQLIQNGLSLHHH